LKEEVRGMARFIVVHTASITEDALKALAKEKQPKGISCKLTYCDFADNKFFCDWEAPNKETVEKAITEKKIPFDAIYPVQLFNVSKGKLEK
jgi:hypothetical protein